MSQNTTLLPEERLNKKNFEAWNFVIRNILQSNKVLKYIISDEISNLVTKVSTSKIVAMVHWLVTMTIRLNLQGSTHTLSKI